MQALRPNRPWVIRASTSSCVAHWIGLSTERMMADIEFWLGHGANRIQFYDGNFFLGRARLIEFCDAILARGFESRFVWIATAVGRRVAKMDDELLARLKRAGLT